MKIKDKFSPDKIFFTADTHFDHTNIIRFSNRPFNSLTEMNEALILKWNQIVPSDGKVFHLGDLAFSNNKRIREITNRLNGTIYMCRGNHDRDKYMSFDNLKYFEDVYEIIVQGSDLKDQKLFLSHYAHLVWNGSHKGSWHLYGHSHGSLPIDPYSYKMDVGVDTNNYQPYRFKEIEELMSIKEFKPLDHHGKKEE